MYKFNILNTSINYLLTTFLIMQKSIKKQKYYPLAYPINPRSPIVSHKRFFYMQKTSLHPRYQNQNLCLNEIPRWFMCMLWLEKH